MRFNCLPNHHLARELRVVLEERLLARSSADRRLHDAVHVGRARHERVLARRGAVPLVGEQLPRVLRVGRDPASPAATGRRRPSLRPSAAACRRSARSRGPGALPAVLRTRAITDFRFSCVTSVSTNCVSASVSSPVPPTARTVRYQRAWKLPRNRFSCRWISDSHFTLATPYQPGMIERAAGTP